MLATVELLEHERATKQLLALERRTARSGRDSIDHPPKGKDDVINAIAGVAYELRDGLNVIATITLEETEAYHEQLRADAAADAERIRLGTQDKFLWDQCLPRQHDDLGRPGARAHRERMARMTPAERRNYGMPARSRR